MPLSSPKLTPPQQQPASPPAQAQPEAMLVPIHLDVGAMARQFADDVPALYRGLLRTGLRKASTASGGDSNNLRTRLAALPGDAERQQALVELAQEEIAAVLALPGASSVPADQPLKDLGLDSLMAVDLQYRLQMALQFAAGSPDDFRQPSVEALAEHLLAGQIPLDLVPA